MNEYICKEVQTENGGYLEIETELIRCNDCKYNLRNPRKWNDDDEVFTYIQCKFMNPDDYCSFAKPKETS